MLKQLRIKTIMLYKTLPLHFYFTCLCSAVSLQSYAHNTHQFNANLTVYQ